MSQLKSHWTCCPLQLVNQACIYLLYNPYAVRPHSSGTETTDGALLNGKYALVQRRWITRIKTRLDVVDINIDVDLKLNIVKMQLFLQDKTMYFWGV